MKAHTLDCSTITSPEGFWDLYLRVVQPESGGYFGRNLDAFNDALAGGPGWPGDCEITLVNWQTLREIDAGYFYTALNEIMSSQDQVRFIWEG